MYALSFLKEAPVDQRSKTVIGWLPAATFATTETESHEEEEAGLQDFVSNGESTTMLYSNGPLTRPVAPTQNVSHDQTALLIFYTPPFKTRSRRNGMKE